MPSRTLPGATATSRLPAAPAASAIAAAGLLGVCALVGALATHNPALGGGLVLAFLCAVAVAYAGIRRVTIAVVAVLPWFVALSSQLPHLTLTVTSAIAATLLLIGSHPRTETGPSAQIAVGLFVVVLVASMIESTAAGAPYEGLKYLLFAAMALVAASPTGRSNLVAMRTPLLQSGVALMALQASADVLHFGVASKYYSVHEQLGLAGEGPHELALTGVLVAAGCLVTLRNPSLRLMATAIAAVPALATGVRSALVALALVLVALIIRTRLRASMLPTVAAIVAIVFVSGVGSIIAGRFEKGVARGEYTNLADAGSGRGSLWLVALDHWKQEGPAGTLFGSGLRSVENIEKQVLHKPNVVQSDPLTLLAELGILGLMLWLALWLVISRSGVNRLILIPLATYALTNGSLEYVGAIVYGLALAGACMTTAPQAEPELQAELELEGEPAL